MQNGKLTIEEINQRQACLMLKHRARVLKSEPTLAIHIIDIRWIRNYAKRFRDDMVKLGLAQQCN